MFKRIYENCDTEHMERALHAFGNGDVGLNEGAPTVFGRRRLRSELKKIHKNEKQKFNRTHTILWASD
jgi:hypothetical protein